VRHVLRYMSRPGLDSPLLVARAAVAGVINSEALLPWKEVRDRWRPHPPVEAVWLHDFLVQDIVEWTQKLDAPGICWYEHDALGTALSAHMPVFGPGEQGDAISTFDGQFCAASIRAHGDGKNLQRFSRNLITTPPANGTSWEQVLGRTHRPGQMADEVEVEVYLHDESLLEAIWKAVEDAQFVEDSQGQPQKLLFADKNFRTVRE